MRWSMVQRYSPEADLPFRRTRGGDKDASRQDRAVVDGEGFFITSARSRPVAERKALLKTMTIDRPGQVYAADITYSPIARGAMYLTAVIDWYSRKALSHRVSNTMARFCVEALREAIDRYGVPEVFNTRGRSSRRRPAYQGAEVASQWTERPSGWTAVCFWRSIKLGEINRQAYTTPAEARERIADYIRYFNEKNPHQGLDNLRLDDVYYRRKPLPKAA